MSPMRTGKSCNAPNCPGIAHDGRYCKEHEHLNKQAQKDYDKKRGTSVERGYDNQWRKVQKMKLRANPLCERCNDIAVLVHHIEPIKTHPELRLAWDNLASICKDCHDEIHKGERWDKWENMNYEQIYIRMGR